MIAALILVVSLVALLQFFVSYCRSLIAAGGRKELSEQARELTGIANRIVRAEEFRRLVQLVELCPKPDERRNELFAVRGYYGLLGLLGGAFRKLVPGVSRWVEREREGCAYFAAVALDRRIAYSRDLMAQQMADRL